MLPDVGRREAGDRLDQLALAVPVDAGDADDLARPHLERHAAHGLEPAAVVHDQVANREERLARLGGALLDVEQHRPADHQLGELALGRAGRRRRWPPPCRGAGP